LPAKVSDDEIYVVVNAGCREKDLAHIGKHLDAYKVGDMLRLVD
jgi:aminomethyltransferase